MIRRSLRSFLPFVTMIAAAGALGAGCSAAPDAGDDAFDAVDSSELSAASGIVAPTAASYVSAVSSYASITDHKSLVKLAGRVYTFLKINRSGAFSEVILDDAGAVVPATTYDALRTKSLGDSKFHPGLASLANVAPTSVVLVNVILNGAQLAIVPKPEVTSNIDATLAELATQHATNVARQKIVKAGVVAQAGISASEIVRDEAGTPFLTLKTTKARLDALSASPAIRAFLPVDDAGRMDLATQMGIANADDVQALGVKGAGVKVAVFEGCPDSTAQLSIAASYTASIGTACSASQHARHTTGIIKNTSAVAGFAPSTSMYSADSTDLAALTWAIDTQRVNVINQSFHRAAEIGDGLQNDDFYKDYKVLHYPWPTISHAAGNWCPSGSSCFEGGTSALSEFVNHKGYNTISVGNHNDTAAAMSASSVFVNPSSAHNDRELPEIAANGENVTAVGLTMSGTSMASPAVVGSIALLQSAQSVLKIWPEGNRALLFAGALRNVGSHPGVTSTGAAVSTANGRWFADLSAGRDGYDGAGALDVLESYRIAQSRYNAAVVTNRGWDIGTMTAASFNASNVFTKTYTFKAPVGATQARVALAWNSTATVTDTGATDLYNSALGMDLDVRVYDAFGTQVARSSSWDNSYEVVDFVPKAGQTYTVKVNRFSTKPGAWTWYGIAFTAI